MDQLLSEAHQEAFLLPEETDLFNLALKPVLLRVLNPNHTSLLFPGSKLKKPDLNSLLQDVPKEIRGRVIVAKEESQAENRKQVQALDLRFSSLTLLWQPWLVTA